MPQMAPMSWTLLFIFFTSILLIIATLNFFIYTPKQINMKSDFMIKKDSKAWKW
uniref:ATP synthase complex subunit 8 n=1 Tax=Macromia daimoji TaxID=1168648 RepID=A0A411NHE1_9ODON|nr:ATP synthase F0 subunit 8 [Macromia daimoji]QBF44103.1 ATP synthase F0 subunit 8 [Macromia daimoji]